MTVAENKTRSLKEFIALTTFLFLLLSLSNKVFGKSSSTLTDQTVQKIVVLKQSQQLLSAVAVTSSGKQVPPQLIFWKKWLSFYLTVHEQKSIPSILRVPKRRPGLLLALRPLYPEQDREVTDL